jgi:hypothetical protein
MATSSSVSILLALTGLLVGAQVASNLKLVGSYPNCQLTYVVTLLQSVFKATTVGGVASQVSVILILPATDESTADCVGEPVTSPGINKKSTGP